MVRTRAGESFPRRDEPAAVLRRVAAGPVRKDKKRKGFSVPATPPPPRVRPEREAAGNPTVVDTDALDCGVCFLPLKPPIFQCNSGHVVCSPCRDKLKATGKCHLCGIATGGGGCLRCHTMESLLESIRVPCPQAINGCTARPAYYDLDMHRQVCLYAGYRCPGKACSFVGSVDALVDHFAGVHGWPRAVKMRAGTYETCRLHLRNGFNFLLADLITATANRQYLFLLNVVRRPFGRAISVAQICPHTAMDERGTSSKGMKFTLTYSSSYEAGQSINYYQSSSFRVARTDPTNKLPSPDGPFQFEVLDSVLGDDEKDAVKVGVRIDL